MEVTCRLQFYVGSFILPTPIDTNKRRQFASSTAFQAECWLLFPSAILLQTNCQKHSVSCVSQPWQVASLNIDNKNSQFGAADI
jgi:hypothetical protein